MEIDYVPHKEIEIAKFIKEFGDNFDFLIGSVHWLSEWGFDLDAKEYEKEIEKQGTERVFVDYFSLIEKAVRSKLFDVMGHIDLIKIFGAKVQNDEYIKRMVSILKECDQIIEINTNGKNKPVKEFYPGIDFLKECFKQGVGITLGSDAHTPGRTGEYFEEAKKMLKDIGYGKLTCFERRKRKEILLN